MAWLRCELAVLRGIMHVGGAVRVRPHSCSVGLGTVVGDMRVCSGEGGGLWKTEVVVEVDVVVN